MFDIIREAPVGQAIRFLSRNRYLQYPEEAADFELPSSYVALLTGSSEKGAPSLDTPEEDITNEPRQVEGENNILPKLPPGDEEFNMEMLGRVNTTSSVRTAPYTNERLRAEQTLEAQRTSSIPIIPTKTADDVVLVDWYTTDDPANPQNWSSKKKGFVVFILAFYTWAGESLTSLQLMNNR
jgi:MFS transporter, DHA1 family, multidrug resistance protein